MPDKEKLRFSFPFRDITEITSTHSFCETSPSTGLALRLSRFISTFQGHLLLVHYMIHSETEKEAGLQQFFLKQEVAVMLWSHQLSPAKAGYHANTSSPCHACLPSQPSPEAVLAPWCLSLPGSFCRFPAPSLWQALHCCYCRMPGFVLVKAGTNKSWI